MKFWNTSTSEKREKFQIYGTQEAYQVFDIKAIFKSLVVEDWLPGWNSDVVFSFKEPWIYSYSTEKSQANFNQDNGMICSVWWERMRQGKAGQLIKVADNWPMLVMVLGQHW